MRACTEFSAIYLYRDAVDFRKSINGLVVLVEQNLARSAFDPALYIFCNKSRDKIKILYWDNTGFAVWYKRLEQHHFKWPKNTQALEMHLSEPDLQRLLSGYDLMGHSALNYLKTY
jgi:transposase